MTLNLSNDTFPFDQPVVWQPDPALMAASNLRQFMDRHQIATYDDLLRRANDDLAWFWSAVLADLDIQFYQPYAEIVDLRNGIQFPQWCVGGELNIIHNCLDKWVMPDNSARERVALRWEGEEGATGTLTYGELNHEVCRCANALRSLGLGKGDVVGLYMPMIPELAIVFLAVVKIGGILLPLFSGYGPAAIVTRLNDAQAKMVITTDGSLRRGKVVAMKATLDEALSEAPSVQQVIVVNRTQLTDLPWTPGRDHWWHDLVPSQPTQAATERTSAEDVLMLIYTSGTTGRPKGAVHTHCGFPVKAAQDMRQAMDLKAQDTLYWMSDMGWMMGPWEVFGVLLNGATMVFYDGGPDYPDVDRLWALVENHQITHLGISPTLIRALKSHGAAPIEKHDITSLRMICSTGSPWDPETWLWLFNTALKGEKPIINYSGGTECSGGILCGNLFNLWC